LDKAAVLLLEVVPALLERRGHHVERLLQLADLPRPAGGQAAGEIAGRDTSGGSGRETDRACDSSLAVAGRREDQQERRREPGAADGDGDTSRPVGPVVPPAGQRLLGGEERCELPPNLRHLLVTDAGDGDLRADLRVV